jgi:hypothetical protein
MRWSLNSQKDWFLVIIAHGRRDCSCDYAEPIQSNTHMTIDSNCGMTLEPKTVTADMDDQENAELDEMMKRFWIGAAPLHVLSVA